MKSLKKTGKSLRSIQPSISKAGIVFELRTLIEIARNRTASAVNAGLTLLYWRIGERIHRETLKGKRAEYGAEILPTLSQQLGWSHFVEVLPVRAPLAREYYAEICRVERWSVRTLRDKIASMLFERTALSRKPEKMVRKEIAALRGQGRLTPVARGHRASASRTFGKRLRRPSQAEKEKSMKIQFDAIMSARN